jgi:LEA14-like dessication related protein
MKSMRITGLVLVLLALISAGCPKVNEVVKEKFTPPTVQVTNVALGGISMEKIDFLVDLEINNPNPIGAKVSTVDYNLFLDDEPLMSGQLQPNVQIKASGITPASVTVSVGFNEAIQIFTRVLGQDTVAYKVTGKVHIASPIGDIPIPFTHEGELPNLDPSDLM